VFAASAIVRFFSGNRFKCGVTVACRGHSSSASSVIASKSSSVNLYCV
jgi:hypothetical protein